MHPFFIYMYHMNSWMRPPHMLKTDFLIGLCICFFLCVCVTRFCWVRSVWRLHHSFLRSNSVQVCAKKWAHHMMARARGQTAASKIIPVMNKITPLLPINIFFFRCLKSCPVFIANPKICACFITAFTKHQQIKLDNKLIRRREKKSYFFRVFTSTINKKPQRNYSHIKQIFGSLILGHATVASDDAASYPVCLQKVQQITRYCPDTHWNFEPSMWRWPSLHEKQACVVSGDVPSH